MKFCKECDNMLYIRLLKEDSNKLIYYCRNCGNSYDEINENNVCVLNTNIASKEKAYLQDINEYTKLDPTLPRTLNIKCPNQSCPSNENIRHSALHRVDGVGVCEFSLHVADAPHINGKPRCRTQIYGSCRRDVFLHR